MLIFLYAIPCWAQSVSFNRDVRPILSDNCFFCHGPDQQESDLRLDHAEVVFAAGVIEPKKPDKSELMARISSSDPDVKMPPAHSNRKLTKQQIATLRKWIEQGAEYEKHWAFVSLPSRQSLLDRLKTKKRE